ncbi:MAG: amino terminal protease family [Bacteroidetes bacterium]|nr:amino terminal protease family [Bacteroidota bacterium]
MKKIENTTLMIKRYNKPFLFYTLSIAIPWVLWFICAYFSHFTPNTKVWDWVTGIFGFLGLIAPLGVALSLILPKEELRKDFLSRFFNFKKIKGEYILIACFLMLLSLMAAQAISLFWGYGVEQFEWRGGFSFRSALFPVWFLLIAAPAVEELAWHSYGTDSLVSRFNLFKASLIFAVIWAIWHLPLSFIKDYYHSNLVESGFLYTINFVVSMFPFVIIMNWLYYKTDRNIILPIIFHITAGFFNEIFMTHPMSKVIQTGLLLIVCVFLLIKDKELFFNTL